MHNSFPSVKSNPLPKKEARLPPGKAMSTNVKVALIGAAATVIVGILSLAVKPGPKPHPVPTMLTVGGRIVDDNSQAPIAGASITATGEPVVITSGTSGNFILSLPTSTLGQTVQIRVDMKGYKSWTGQLGLPSSENVIQLTPETENVTHIPDGDWSGKIPEVDTTIGGGSTCIYDVSFKNIVISFKIRGGEITDGTLSYRYQDIAPNCSSPSGIPDTGNQFALGSSNLSRNTLHIEFIQQSGLPPATTKLDAVYDGVSSMKGRVTMTRTNLIGNLNWNVIQSIPLIR